MKKIILAALAASVIAAPVAAAPRHEGRSQIQQVQKNKQVRVIRNNGRQVVTTRQVTKFKQARNVQQRKWNRGQRFDSRYATNYRVINNPRAYRLKDAPRGYRYVQSGNDAVLVGITSGIVAAIFGSIL
jgi:Ni/Co efflux regulator RcnB